MKRLFAVLLLCLAFVFPVNAVTVWYEPTPYPKSVLDAGATKTPPLAPHITDGWVNNWFGSIKPFQDTDQLKIGGYGDTYLSLLNFNDLEGLPQQADNAYLYLYSLPRGGASPSQVALFRATSSWNTSVVWGNPNQSGYPEPYAPPLPTLGSGYAYSPSPGVNVWYPMWITPFYNGWKNGTYQNYGLVIYPNDGNNNQFDYFISSNSSGGGGRPILRLDFTPTLTLKMPLPGNHQWLATVETGGFDCLGPVQGNTPWPDTAHQLSNYFSIDFSWRNIADNGATIYTETSNIPVIAAAGGRVVFAGTDPNKPDNGYFVVINHSGGVDETTGFTTRYLHLKASSIVVIKDQIIQQGERLGYMGNTGASNGTHVHFGVRYNNNGASSVLELTKVVMDGLILKGFQTECTVDANGNPVAKNRYYRSGNLVY